MPNSYKQLPDPEVRERRCLPCGKNFLSQHAGNRICPKCRGLKEQGRERQNLDAETAMYGGVRRTPRSGF
jgi:hypothetical protein